MNILPHDAMFENNTEQGCFQSSSGFGFGNMASGLMRGVLRSFMDAMLIGYSEKTEMSSENCLIRQMRTLTLFLDANKGSIESSSPDLSAWPMDVPTKLHSDFR